MYVCTGLFITVNIVNGFRNTIPPTPLLTVPNVTIDQAMVNVLILGNQ